MALDFTKCDGCGKIFPATEDGQIICPACRGEDVEPTDKDMLRTLKNTLRDIQAKGEFLNIPQLAEVSGVEEVKIWHYINTGELTTASFDDPAVRDYLVRKKREMAKQSKSKSPKRDVKKPEKSSSKKKSSGFHLSGKDGKK